MDLEGTIQIWHRVQNNSWADVGPSVSRSCERACWEQGHRSCRSPFSEMPQNTWAEVIFPLFLKQQKYYIKCLIL